MDRKSLRDTVLDNFDWDKVQKHRNSEYAKIRPEQLFELLSTTSGRAKTEATRLLNELASRSWYIHNTAHEGGSNPNAPLHILLMAPRGIHLNCKKKPDGTLYIYEISRTESSFI